MQLVLTVLIAIHGAIHILGFFKWSGLIDISELSGWTLIPLSPALRWLYALLWLAVVFLLIAASALRLALVGQWWVPGLIGVALSQTLIVLAFRDAKFGTIANCILFLPILAAGARERFDRSVEREVDALFRESASAPHSKVTREDLAMVPAPVALWLERSGTLGRERIGALRLRQRGELRSSPEGAWMPVSAQQYFVVDEPAFIWRVDALMGGFLPLSGRDRYAAGRGQMQIDIASLVRVVDVDDDKIAQGAMLRFLGEIVWFPSAALSQYLEWEAVDARSARAMMRHAGLAASATFTFDGEGRVRNVEAERYLGGGADAKLTPWKVVCSEWRALEGIEIPVRGDVRWLLPQGESSYYRWEIFDIDYERRELYEPQGLRED